MSSEDSTHTSLEHSANAEDTLRIGVFIQHYPPKLGGAERQAQLLASEFARRGNAVDVITTRHRQDLPSHSQAQGLSIWRLPTASPRWLKLPVNLVMGFYGGFKTCLQLDIIHAHCLSPFVLGALLAAKLARLPVLIKVCSIGEYGDISKVKGFGPGSLLWPLYRMADKFIAPTPAVARELLSEGSRPAQVSIIPNLLLEQGAAQAPGKRMELRKKLGLPERITLLYVGRLHAGKGLSTLMSVWPAIIRQYDVQLVLVGEGPEYDNIEQWRSNNNCLESVTLTGYQSDPDNYYRASDIFVFPSSSETFGNAIVEAMSHGLAVATTRVGVVSDWPEDAPIAGFEAGNVDELKSLLCRLIEDANWRHDLGHKAADFIGGRYGVNTIADEYLLQYRQLTGRTVIEGGTATGGES